jgi:hypothetical protein
MLRWGKPRWNGVPWGCALQCLNAMGYLHGTVSAGGNDKSTQLKKLLHVVERSYEGEGGTKTGFGWVKVLHTRDSLFKLLRSLGTDSANLCSGGQVRQPCSYSAPSPYRLF